MSVDLRSGNGTVAKQGLNVSVITFESQKLRERYADFLATRKEPAQLSTMPTITASQITTDDERIILYYILEKNVRKVSKETINDWLHKSEIYDVNIDNAFDLLASLGGGDVINDILEFGISTFREYSANAATMLTELSESIKRHTKIAADTFKALWASNTWNPIMGLFVAYIVDEGMYSFGSRWMADAQIENIEQWENKHTLDFMLSNNYGKCLEIFI